MGGESFLLEVQTRIRLLSNAAGATAEMLVRSVLPRRFESALPSPSARFSFVLRRKLVIRSAGLPSAIPGARSCQKKLRGTKPIQLDWHDLRYVVAVGGGGRGRAGDEGVS